MVKQYHDISESSPQANNEISNLHPELSVEDIVPSLQKLAVLDILNELNGDEFFKTLLEHPNDPSIINLLNTDTLNLSINQLANLAEIYRKHPDNLIKTQARQNFVDYFEWIRIAPLETSADLFKDIFLFINK